MKKKNDQGEFSRNQGIEAYNQKGSFLLQTIKGFTRRSICHLLTLFFVSEVIHIFPYLQEGTINSKAQFIFALVLEIQPFFIYFEVVGSNNKVLRKIVSIVSKLGKTYFIDSFLKYKLKNLNDFNLIFNFALTYVEGIRSREINSESLEYLRHLTFPKDFLNMHYLTINVGTIFCFDTTFRENCFCTSLMDFASRAVYTVLRTECSPTAEQLLNWLLQFFYYKASHLEVILHCDTAGFNSSILLQKSLETINVFMSFCDPKCRPHSNHPLERYHRTFWNILLFKIVIKGFENVSFFDLPLRHQLIHIYEGVNMYNNMNSYANGYKGYYSPNKMRLALSLTKPYFLFLGSNKSEIDKKFLAIWQYVSVLKFDALERTVEYNGQKNNVPLFPPRSIFNIVRRMEINDLSIKSLETVAETLVEFLLIIDKVKKLKTPVDRCEFFKKYYLLNNINMYCPRYQNSIKFIISNNYSDIINNVKILEDVHIMVRILNFLKSSNTFSFDNIIG